MYDRRPGFVRGEDIPQPLQAARRVEAKVKWFNAAKGFGFVSLSDGSPDAFLPLPTLRRAGHEDLREGTVLLCEIGTGAKGPLVMAVLSVDTSAAAPPARGSAGRPAGSGKAQVVEGTVKWFEPEKGFGFIARDDADGSGKDVFVHVTALRRSGIQALSPGQRVRIDAIEGRKGLEAERLTII